ncbi:DNA-directed RNA polymerase subunit alpha [Haploplasma axanthum]|uniref:DNA-directed RNA polymerase subunit alpha n=1 Tax=Haploplasma axanthum TaxID=29552 RepID=A0A449BCF8_HAPAX|nr:DNA-directed RNA polymerase subunit alpha [Haploplasma axanthum]VEU80117.1 DNA-directed RNA polymerase subunit alpha [Haploplasma axanthum]
MKELKFEKPNVEVKVGENNTIEYQIKPLDRGFGITLGNTLRRVLLSSIPGAAIVNVKIDGVEHEFSTIEGVYEDVMGIILNLKQVVFSVDSEDPNFEQTIELYAEGPMTVTAADFNKVTGVNVINPDQVIANLADKGTLSMEVTVRRGVGYVSAQDNKIYNYNRLGVIAIDSIFSPVKRVSYHVDKIRGDNDSLTMNIETDGSIDGREVLPIASKMLVDYLNAIVEISDEVINADYIKEQEKEPINEKLEMSIDKLDLTVRLYNSLKRSGIYTVAQIVNETEEDIMRLRSLGRKSFRELKEKLEENGLSFANSTLKDDKKKSLEEEEE